MTPIITSPPLWAAISGGFVVAVALLVLWRQSRRYPYQARAGLFSPAELRFFRVLERALEQRVRIYAKVRLADLIQVRPNQAQRSSRRAFGAIACKHIDYVLCDDAHRILCAIELDDRSHQAVERRRRDEFVDAALKAAGIPLLRFPVQARYELAPLRQRLHGLLSRQGLHRVEQPVAN